MESRCERVSQLVFFSLRLPLLGGRREEPLPSRHLTLLSQCDRNSYPENHLSDIGR